MQTTMQAARAVPEVHCMSPSREGTRLRGSTGGTEVEQGDTEVVQRQ